MTMNVGSKRTGAIAEINVTPMADVMIVLLIIFMVVTPIISRIDANLPPATFSKEGAGDPPLDQRAVERLLVREELEDHRLGHAGRVRDVARPRRREAPAREEVHRGSQYPPAPLGARQTSHARTSMR